MPRATAALIVLGLHFFGHTGAAGVDIERIDVTHSPQDFDAGKPDIPVNDYRVGNSVLRQSAPRHSKSHVADAALIEQNGDAVVVSIERADISANAYHAGHPTLRYSARKFTGSDVTPAALVDNSNGVLAGIGKTNIPAHANHSGYSITRKKSTPRLNRFGVTPSTLIDQSRAGTSLGAFDWLVLRCVLELIGLAALVCCAWKMWEYSRIATRILEAARTIQDQEDKRKEFATLGVVRLDYNYPPSKGDVDHPESFNYKVFYKAVPGFTFELCQSGVLTPEIRNAFIETIKWLDQQKNVSAITGDCGFMMWFQELARQHTKKPVIMSALVQLPSLISAFDAHELIAIFTANCKALEPMHDLIKQECGVDTHDKRFVMVGCQDVPGFEAVAEGKKVDVAKVTPGIVAKAKEIVAKYPVRAILFECTELPAYSDAVRAATGVPVFDAITCCDFFIAGLTDNPRFGKNDWQKSFDGQVVEYDFEQDLAKQAASSTSSAPQKKTVRKPPPPPKRR